MEYDGPFPEISFKLFHLRRMSEFLLFYPKCLSELSGYFKTSISTTPTPLFFIWQRVFSALKQMDGARVFQCLITTGHRGKGVNAGISPRLGFLMFAAVC